MLLGAMVGNSVDLPFGPRSPRPAARRSTVTARGSTGAASAGGSSKLPGAARAGVPPASAPADWSQFFAVLEPVYGAARAAAREPDALNGATHEKALALVDDLNARASNSLAQGRAVVAARQSRGEAEPAGMAHALSAAEDYEAAGSALRNYLQTGDRKWLDEADLSHERVEQQRSALETPAARGTGRETSPLNRR